MDEFDYLSEGMELISVVIKISLLFFAAESDVNLQFRITLIGISFKAMTTENAKQPQKPPMG